MSATSIHGVSIPLDSFGQASALGATDAEMEARASLREALRCAASGRIDRALAQARDVFGNDAASMELRLEAAKLCVDWHASLGAYEQCRKVAADAARLGASRLERDHPLILMLRNSEAYWLAVLGCEDMAARKFSALVADVKSCPNLDPQLAFAIRNNSAMPWKSTGKWAKAARVYRELLADMEPQCEAEDMTVLTVRDNLAEVLSADRQYEEALHLYEINMEALLRITDRGDWRVLRLRNEIARNTWMGGDREAGEDLWTVLAEDCRRYLGDRDEFTARIRTILLMLATLRGDEEKVMSIARKLQADHPDDWDECDMSEAVALLAEAGITGEDFR
mgnify:CR=1 FL=1